jgi:hypothetical protein
MRSSGTQSKISGVFARTFLVAIVAIARRVLTIVDGDGFGSSGH